MQANEIRKLPAAFVSKASANERIRNYQDTKLPLLSAAIGKTDTCSIWYAIEHLEQLIAELRYQQASGLRVYLGAYSADHPDFSNQLCLIMIPTTEGTVSGQYPDLILEETAGFQARYGIFDPAEIDTIYKSFNFGSPCPPACISGDTFFPE